MGADAVPVDMLIHCMNENVGSNVKRTRNVRIAVDRVTCIRTTFVLPATIMNVDTESLGHRRSMTHHRVFVITAIGKCPRVNL